jgi:hypothetical protein
MLTELGPHVEETTNTSRAVMRLASMRILAAAFGAAVVFAASDPGFAQSAEPKSDKQHTGEGKDAQKKIDELAEAEKVLGGPAAHPECVWLGRRVVSLLWRDDLDTAFRHLDLYDRFGCPAGHIQAAFRCVIKQGDPDQKATEKHNNRVHGCWINPSADARGTAAAPTGSTNR